MAHAFSPVRFRGPFRSGFALFTAMGFASAPILSARPARAHPPLPDVVGRIVTAQTQAAEDFDALVKQALELYRARRYLEAVEAFEKAYAIEPRPELRYNIARSYEKALDPDQAIANYEAFLKLPGTTADLRTRALESIAALRREQAARVQAESTQASRPDSPQAEVQTRAPAPAKDRTLEWLLIGGGAALAATGAVFGILALDADSELDDARQDPTTSPSRLQDLSDETETNALVADILIGAGIVSAVVGIVIFATTGNGEASVSVAPAPTANGGGIVINGQF